MVVQFQKINKLESDGVVGMKTWNALGQNISKIVAENIMLNITAPWYDVAKAELGTRENSKVNKHNMRIVEYHSTTTLGAKTDEIPWCSSFVNWGVKVTTPIQGDIVILKKKVLKTDKGTGSSTGYHVAFFVSKSPTHIRLLGGNQRDSVKYSIFSLSR